MTQSNRESHIATSLAEYSRQAGMRDTMRVPLRGGITVPVIEIPLDLPILNTDSFRIAPALADHPDAEVVRKDPEGPDAQRIVEQLVRQAHRKADELKESLVDGQDNPGVVTRKGKLLNANTRCVLLRELWAEGTITRNSIRVGVLPADVNEAEELQLESVLQKQREYKDEYNLPGELMMLRKLYDDAKMTDAQIAKQLRIRRAQTVADLRAVLDLMERARHLTDPPLPVADFISEQDQRQNWLELLAKVKDVDRTDGREAGNQTIRRWLIAYMLGQSSVHKLRHAKGSWVEDDVFTDLSEERSATAKAIVASAMTDDNSNPTNSPAPAGLDFLGDSTEDPSTDGAVHRLLGIVVDAKNAGDGDITLADGRKVPAPEARAALTGSVKRSLDAAKRKADAGDRLQRPANLIESARKTLKDAAEALEDVIDEPGFEQFRSSFSDTFDEVAEIIDRLSDILQESTLSRADA